MSRFIREKKTEQGQYLAVDIYTYTTEQERQLRRSKKRKVSPPKKIKANDRQAVKKFTALLNTNFKSGDLRLDLTYAGTPPTRKEALKQVTNFIERLKRLYKKHGKELKYIIVTESGNTKADGTPTRIHHHIIINAGIDRNEIEKCWCLGRTKCEYLQILSNENGLEALAHYLLKHKRTADEKGLCKWSGSRNLKKPIETINDNRYTLSEIEKIYRAEQAGEAEQRIEKKYKGYKIIKHEITVNAITGFISVSAYLYKPNKEETDRRSSPHILRQIPHIRADGSAEALSLSQE